MKKWKYIQVSVNPAYLPINLNEYGEEGWECVAVLNKEQATLSIEAQTLRSQVNPMLLVIFKQEQPND